MWVVLSLFISLQSWGQQYDLSNKVLIRRSAPPPSKNQLDSSRYTIRAKPAENAPAQQPTLAPAKKDPPATPAAPVASVPTAVTSSPTPAEIVTPAPVVVEATTAEPPITEQVTQIVLGGSIEEIEAFRDQLPPNDKRNNLVEISVAPAYVYTDSSSNYWYRDYYLSSPAYALGAQVWITPFFGVNMDMVSTLDSSMSASHDSSNRIKADQQWFNGGLRWRKFWGTGKKINTLSLGMDFAEYKLKVPATTVNRTQNKTSGIKLYLEASMYRNGSGDSWQMGASLIPRASHEEPSAGSAVKSGTSSNSTVISAWVGSETSFDRQVRVFWRLEEIIERNLFEGDATGPDPETGVTPNGVSVNQSTTMFIFGVRWGH